MRLVFNTKISTSQDEVLIFLRTGSIGSIYITAKSVFTVKPYIDKVNP